MTNLVELMSVRDAVAQRGGVVRVVALVRDGWSRYRVQQALEREELLRVRRDWVAVTAADPALIAAAREGVVLSCITEARRRGLWVQDEGMPHVAAGAHARGGKSGRAHVHWGAPLVPRHPDALTDPIENALAYIAVCQPHDAALATWDSARKQGLVSPDVMGRLPLGDRARSLLTETIGLLDSGLEMIFFTRLKWLRVRIVPQAWIEGHRVDFLIGERLIVQIDGGHHVGAQRTSDVAHDARLLVRGYRVIRVTYSQIMNDWAAVQDVIARAVAQGMHRAR